jgi:hypothetical protein
MSYEFQLVQGIPALVEGDRVCTWEPDEPVQFGKLDGDGRIVFDTDWEDKLAPAMAAWRATLGPRNRAELRNSRKNTRGSKTKHARN